MNLNIDMNTLSEDEKEYIQIDKAELWMIALLRMNPEYHFWKPGIEYLIGTNSWSSWKDMIVKIGEWPLDDYNEVVNFRFDIVRDYVPCTNCEIYSGVWDRSLNEEEMLSYCKIDGYDKAKKMFSKRVGTFDYCQFCNGNREIFTEDNAHVELHFWVIGPRKGTSYGVTISRIDQDDVPDVLAWLTKAANRNAERFSKVVQANSKNE